jgi:ribosomal protein S18 acetylase RimI-like enzyme
MIIKVPVSRKNRSYSWEWSKRNQRLVTNATDKLVISNFSMKPKIISKLIEPYLIKQAFKLQIHRHGMRWSLEDFREVLHSDYFWACFITSAVNNFSYLLRGFIILNIMGEESEILSISVNNRERKKGTGNYLIKQAINFSISQNVKSVFLEVSKTNRPAIRFYCRHCFVNVGLRKNYYRFSSTNKKDAMIMCLHL